jgi:hypothetical protein
MHFTANAGAKSKANTAPLEQAPLIWLKPINKLNISSPDKPEIFGNEK